MNLFYVISNAFLSTGLHSRTIILGSPMGEVCPQAYQRYAITNTPISFFNLQVWPELSGQKQ